MGLLLRVTPFTLHIVIYIKMYIKILISASQAEITFIHLFLQLKINSVFLKVIVVLLLKKEENRSLGKYEKCSFSSQLP